MRLLLTVLLFLVFSVSNQTDKLGGAVAQRVERWTCDQQVMGSILARGKAA